MAQEFYNAVCPECGQGASGIASNAGNVIYFKCHKKSCLHTWVMNAEVYEMSIDLSEAKILLARWLDTMIGWQNPVMEATRTFLHGDREQIRKDFSV